MIACFSLTSPSLTALSKANNSSICTGSTSRSYTQWREKTSRCSAASTS
jgi:hypothetical protein